jgi:hypothetical protein
MAAMTRNLQRWVAMSLLALAAFSASASACAAACAAGSGSVTLAATATGNEAAPVSEAMHEAADGCPLSQLCDFAATPVVLAPHVLQTALVAAYVPPLAASQHYHLDPAPPQKPPAA